MALKKHTLIPTKEIRASMTSEQADEAMSLCIAEDAMIEQGDEPLQPLNVQELWSSPEAQDASLLKYIQYRMSSGQGLPSWLQKKR